MNLRKERWNLIGKNSKINDLEIRKIEDLT